jgi:hypothetical protein
MQEQAPAPVPRKPVDISSIMRSEILLAIAGLLTLLAGVGYKLGSESVLVTEIIIGLIMIYSAIVSLGFISILRDVFPVISVSAVCGFIVFFFNIEILVRWYSHWSLVVGLIAGLIALFAAFVGYFKPAFARAK